MITVIDNLSPLVGTKIESKYWNPRTAWKVVSELEIAGLVCTNLTEDNYKKAYIDYTFRNRVTVQTSNIYKLAKDYSREVMDSSYIINVVSINSKPITPKEVLFLYSRIGKINDSAILDVFEKNTKLKYCGYYKHVLLILLDAFSLRWSLFEAYKEDKTLEAMELTQSRLDLLIENIRYVKAKLEEWDSLESSDLRHHLNTLQFNVQAIRGQLSNRIIVGGKRWRDYKLM